MYSANARCTIFPYNLIENMAINELIEMQETQQQVEQANEEAGTLSGFHLSL